MWLLSKIQFLNSGYQSNHGSAQLLNGHCFTKKWFTNITILCAFKSLEPLNCQFQPNTKVTLTTQLFDFVQCSFSNKFQFSCFNITLLIYPRNTKSEEVFSYRITLFDPIYCIFLFSATSKVVTTKAWYFHGVTGPHN